MHEPNDTPSPDTPQFARWTQPAMAAFLRALSATHSVATAARSIGLSRQSAYWLRARLKGQPFDIAWEAAFQHGYDELAQAALDRALHGVEVPVFHKGEQVGTRRHYDERLTCFLLAARNRYGAQRLGRYTAAGEFWSERWDRLLSRVEHGPLDWERLDPQDAYSNVPRDAAAAAEPSEEERRERRDSEDRQAATAAEQRHAPDPLPRGRDRP